MILCHCFDEQGCGWRGDLHLDDWAICPDCGGTAEPTIPPVPEKKEKGPRRPPGRRPAETLMTVTQVAALKGVTERAIRSAISRGSIRADQIGSRWVIRKSDAEQWQPNLNMGRPKKGESNGEG